MIASTILGARHQLNNLENTCFWPYLQDNDLPPLSLLNDLKRNLRRRQRELAHIDRSINVLSITLNTLIRARHSMYQAIAVYHPILSPIRRFPDDVLAEIFIRCLPLDGKVVPYHLDAPLVFSLVCRQWRAVSLATPQLWSTLHVTIPWSDSSLVPVTSLHNTLPNATVSNVQLWSLCARALEEWIRRSRVCPLSLSVYIFDNAKIDTHNFTENFSPITLICFPSSHRKNIVGLK
ncbi:hypothetical protein BJ165DRAFT_261220 [Panaeolus papilionaceus]|nr:hypothetical protein BJ165DRAFT_261220 [Panaeolus papilionaceus]